MELVFYKDKSVDEKKHPSVIDSISMYLFVHTYLLFLFKVSIIFYSKIIGLNDHNGLDSAVLKVYLSAFSLTR